MIHIIILFVMNVVVLRTEYSVHHTPCSQDFFIFTPQAQMVIG